jgi:hypothetical protein
VLRSSVCSVGVVPARVAIGVTRPDSSSAPAKLRRHVGGSTARRSVRARLCASVMRVARQARSGRPVAGLIAASHPLITRGRVVGSPAATTVPATAWACARRDALNKISASRVCSFCFIGWRRMVSSPGV